MGRTFKARGVVFELDKEGRVRKIVGYTPLHKKICLRFQDGGLRLHANTFEDAAFSLGLRDPEELTRHLTAQGIVLTEQKYRAPKIVSWFLGARNAA